MAVITHAATGFPVADPEVSPLHKRLSERKSILTERDSMILSASGWRKVFSVGGDESADSEISSADGYLIAIAGIAIARFFCHIDHGKGSTIVVGIDSRPTGPVIADILIRTLIAHNLKVRYLFIAAAPEIMAYVRTQPDIDGFIYISASHNPIGHNGLKFGLGDGAVMGGAAAVSLIAQYNGLCGEMPLSDVEAAVDSCPSTLLHDIYGKIPNYKAEAITAYHNFSLSVLAGTRDLRAIEKLKSTLKGTEGNAIGIVAELNGSARTVSIDRDYLVDIGACVDVVNGTPRQISHRIVPEGESLDECRLRLETLHQTDRRFILGYVPDNDGDRGNIVYLDENTGRACILHAQQVFALVVLAELSFAAYQKQDLHDWLVVVNGPTSMVVERICDVFGVKVIRCEVGEANVVSAAREYRDNGHTVRIMGEGSNGGNITFPAEVRDPINTIGSFIKILSLKGPDGPFALWHTLSGVDAPLRPDFGIADIVATLPPFVTTSAYENRALMSITTTNHAELKRRYEEIFAEDWEKRRPRLEAEYGIESFREINYEGTQAKEGSGPGVRSGEQKGGLKNEFLDSAGVPRAFIWMRGSGTEPVFRILADVEGGDEKAVAMEDYLLNWQREMIQRADLPL